MARVAKKTAAKKTATKKTAAKAKTPPNKAAAKKAPARKRKARPIPDNYPVIGVTLRIGGAQEALHYYCQLFGGKLRMRLDMPDGRVGHAEIQIGKGVLMVSDEYPEMNMVGPVTIGQSSVTLQIYVKDVDATLARAVKTGSKVLRPINNEFYGDRSVTIEDPFGYVWMIQTHVEDVTQAEMKRRLKNLFPPS